jgi:hypothetical protein
MQVLCLCIRNDMRLQYNLIASLLVSVKNKATKRQLVRDYCITEYCGRGGTQLVRDYMTTNMRLVRNSVPCTLVCTTTTRLQRYAYATL